MRSRLNRTYLFSRLFEWTMALALLQLGIWLLLWPRAIEASSFRFIFLDHAEWQWLLPWFFLFVSSLRAAALVANGAWPRLGPKLRQWAALGTALIWGEMAFALLLLIPNVGTPPSPGIPVYFTLTAGELLACYMAACNGKSGRGAG